MECNIAELIVMTIYFSLLETRIVLRTILSAGVLAVLLVLACAGAAAGVGRWCMGCVSRRVNSFLVLVSVQRRVLGSVNRGG